MKELDSVAVAQVSKALNTLVADFGKLTDTGCIDNCAECPFGKIINNGSDCYEHGSCEIRGETTICDLLGILSDTAKNERR